MVQGKKPRREEEKGMKSLMAFFTAGMMTAPGIASGGIVAGAAKLAITPDPKGMKVYLAGFGNNRVATGVHDDIWARGLVIGDGKKTIAIVGLDLIGLFWDDVQRIREKAREEGIAVDYILVSSTHNHEGPDTLGLWGPSPIQSGINTGYQEFVISTAVRVLKEAISRLKPARIKVVEVDGPELYDLMNDGRIPIVKDPSVRAMMFVGEDGDTISVLINWSNHPEALGGSNTYITSDYVGYLRDEVEGLLGGTALFLVGAIGGLMTPLGDLPLEDPETGGPPPKDSFRKAELLGKRVAGITARALSAKAEYDDVSSIEVLSKRISVPVSNVRFRLAEMAGVFKGRRKLVREKDGSVSVESEVCVIRFSGKGGIEAEFIGIPGEIYPELVRGGITRYSGADFPDAPFEPIISRYAKGKVCFYIGLANDEIGYIVPKAEWDEKPPWLNNREDAPYGEVNSVGPDAASATCSALVELLGPPREFGLDDIVEGDVEKVASGFQFTEGPVWHPSGFLLFSDIPANTIYKLSPMGKVEPFRSPSGNSNGLSLDFRRRLLACEHGNRRVSRTEEDGSVVSLAERYRGKRLNSPNDLVVRSDGTIYFTDPPYGVDPKDRELDFQGVYMIRPDGDLVLLLDDFDRPNGITLSPDESILYVADTNRNHVRAFDLMPDGRLGNQRVFAVLEKDGIEGRPDGMKVDVLGNLYVAGSVGIWVFDPGGRLIGIIRTPEAPANCAFGGYDGRTLFITARSSIYSVRTRFAGQERR
jgi:gluconolactonase